MSSGAVGASAKGPDETRPTGGAAPLGARSAMFDYVVDTTHEAVIAIDLDGTVSIWNPAAERLTGRARTEAVGAPIHQSLELTEEILHDRLRRAAHGEDRIEDRRAEIRRSDGSLTPVALSVSPLLDDGDPHGAVAVIRDVTEQIEVQTILADVQRRMADAQRLAQIGLWTWARSSGEVQWSSQLHEIAGVSPIDFGGDLDAHLAAFASDIRDEVYARMQAAADAQGHFEMECVVVRPDGTQRWVHLSGEPNHDASGRFTGLTGICQDVTERHEAMEALEEADRLKDEFLGVVSHELRTPLTSIMGFGNLLSQNATDDIASMCEVIMRNATEMHAMVGRILDFSRAQSGRLELTVGDHDVHDVVSEVLTLVESFVSEHQVDVEVAEGLQVHADADGLRRVLVNLLTNAGKFTPPGRRISVRAEAHGDRCRISVADEGPGIPDDELESVFERFFQSKSTEATTTRGAGVGLSIVRTYTQAMDGDVWAENLPDAGCRFVVDLPSPAP